MISPIQHVFCPMLYCDWMFLKTRRDWETQKYSFFRIFIVENRALLRSLSFRLLAIHTTEGEEKRREPLPQHLLCCWALSIHHYRHGIVPKKWGGLGIWVR